MSNHSHDQRPLRLCGWLQRFCAATTLALLCSAGGALALETDRDQPIKITADTAIRDEKQGFTVYSGNVHMIQGSLDIKADKLTIFHELERADKIIAEGRPAKMKQKPAPEEPLVRARANIIEYYKSQERIHLRINAHIAQDGSTVTGDSIDYLIAEQLVKADSDQAQDGNRVKVVIQPELVRDEDDATTAAPIAQEESAASGSTESE